MTTIDRCFLSAALTATLGSWLWLGWSEWEQRRAPEKARRPAPVVTVDQRDVSSEEAKDTATEWNLPPAQSRGAEWRYDLFTPPEVHYDAATRQLAVRVPDKPVRGAELASEIELVSVTPTAFRLQLLGYVGDARYLRGAFENRLTGEVFLASAGRRVPELDLEIVDFAVRRVPGHLGEASSQWVATATARDRRTGLTATLTAGEACYTPVLKVQLATEDEDGKVIGSFSVGDEIEAENCTYRIGRLQLAPPEVELVDKTSQVARILRLKSPTVAAAEVPEAGTEPSP